MKFLVKSAFALIALAVLAACGDRVPLPLPPGSSQAAIAVPDTFSVQVASDVLAKGGNAVDAAVAVAFSLAVTYPEAGNLGGGGFMLTWVDGKASFIDYRETAPAAADRDMYLDSHGEVVEGLSLTGVLAAGVPGTVAGMWQAQQRLGRLEWKDLLAPAIDLAEHGFRVPAKLESAAREEMPRLGESTNFAKYFGGLRAGTLFRQPELAATLKRIRDGGASGFYAGETASLIAGQMHRMGGSITLADLTGYQAVWREPLLAPWRDYSVLAAPPPSSGGIAVIQLLKMKDRLAPEFKGLGHQLAAVRPPDRRNGKTGVCGSGRVPRRSRPSWMSRQQACWPTTTSRGAAAAVDRESISPGRRRAAGTRAPRHHPFFHRGSLGQRGREYLHLEHGIRQRRRRRRRGFPAEQRDGRLQRQAGNAERLRRRRFRCQRSAARQTHAFFDVADHSSRRTAA